MLCYTHAFGAFCHWEFIFFFFYEIARVSAEYTVRVLVAHKRGQYRNAARDCLFQLRKSILFTQLSPIRKIAFSKY